MEADERECPFCAEIIKAKAKICKHCNKDLYSSNFPSVTGDISPKSKATVILLALFLGCLGAHRFYVGKIGTGILMLLTFGGIGIWALIDLVVAICGRFTDAQGKLVDR